MFIYESLKDVFVIIKKVLSEIALLRNNFIQQKCFHYYYTVIFKKKIFFKASPLSLENLYS